MAKDHLLVTGASGQLGRRVLELLLERDQGPLVATTRTPDALDALRKRGVEVRPADFDDEAGLASAFRGVERALLISTDALDRPGRRIAQHTRALRALEAAGASHVTYTSLPNPVGSSILIADDHAATEAALASSKLDYTVLRNNWYADMLPMSLPAAVASGELITARAQGAVAYVTREDCARTAAAVLADRAHRGRSTFDVTGDRAWTGDQLAALLTELFARQVTHRSVPSAAFAAGLVAHGLPEGVAALLTSFEIGTARGELEHVSDSVQKLSGRAPESLRSFLEQRRAVFERAV